MRYGIYSVVLALLMVAPLAHAFTLVCPAEPLDTTVPGTYTIHVEINTTNGELATSIARYRLLDGNIAVSEGNAVLGDPVSSDGYYLYPISFDANLEPRDAVYIVFVELNVNGYAEQNPCKLITYDRPRIVTSPDLSAVGDGYINVRSVSIDCNDSSQCYITQIYLGEEPVLSEPVVPPFEVNLPEGSYTIRIAAVDEYNNEANASYTVSVDSTAPFVGDFVVMPVQCEEAANTCSILRPATTIVVQE